MTVRLLLQRSKGLASVNEVEESFIVIGGGKRRCISVGSGGELNKNIVEEFGRDGYLVQDGRIRSVDEVSPEKMVRWYGRLRGGMFAGQFARFAPRKDVKAVDL
jgi:3-oxoacyl-(acyl-carrier-protein) synthase